MTLSRVSYERKLTDGPSPRRGSRIQACGAPRQDRSGRAPRPPRRYVASSAQKGKAGPQGRHYRPLGGTHEKGPDAPSVRPFFHAIVIEGSVVARDALDPLVLLLRF